MGIVLRPYQETIVSEVRSEMAKGNRAILVQSPTGSGKTALTAEMLMRASSRGMDSQFIVHRRELVRQSIRTFEKVGVNHGVVAAGFPMNLIPKVQIASIATLANRYQNLRKPTMIIWDECHHIAAGTWEKIFRANPQAFHVGLTATPERLDGQGLGQYFKVMIKGPKVSWLIENNYLSKYKAFAPNSLDLTGVHTRMGDFVKSELASILDKPTITGNAVAEYKKRAAGKRFVGFCLSVEHSKHMSDQYRKAGFRVQHVDGESDAKFRDDAIQAFSEGYLDGLLNVDLFGEGFDLPAIECVQMLRPTQSLGLYLQQVGRALRPYETKEHAIILDHVGNIERHGLPDEDREWSLDGRDIGSRKAKSEAAVKVCSKCFAAHNPGRSHCQYCGTAFEVKDRSVAQADGDLEEISSEEIKRRRELRKKQQSQLTYQELIELGKQRGYKDAQKWAFFQNRHKQRKKLGIA